jgi:hypothetical protein
MQEDYIECPELSGKTIQILRIHRNTGDGTDVQIELTDGTSFTCCLSNQPAVKASFEFAAKEKAKKTAKATTKPTKRTAA